MRTPTMFIRKCEVCGNEITDIRKPGISQYTEGWVRQREGGGGHGISRAVRHNRWAHAYCVEGDAVAGQSSFFGAP